MWTLVYIKSLLYSFFVCIYIYVCVCVYVCLRTCMGACVHACIVYVYRIWQWNYKIQRLKTLVLENGNVWVVIWAKDCYVHVKNTIPSFGIPGLYPLRPWYCSYLQATITLHIYNFISWGSNKTNSSSCSQF